MEVVMKTKEVFSLLWAKLFEGWGNRTMKQAQLRRQRGGIFFLRGKRTRICFEQGSERRG